MPSCTHSITRFALRTVIGICLLFSVVFHVSTTIANEKEIERLKSAVVKIYTASAAPDYFTPWRLLNPQQSSGSGAAISGNRILTNAHVIADARYVQVQKNSDPQKHLAHVEFVSHAADLAIIRVDDQAFFDNLNPLAFGKLPEPLQEVSVYGYPYGGNSLSITRGILSRVEHQYYSHSNHYLLAGQIDAAINPGNSGGPVIVDNKIVGVVMQANFGSQTENQGYFVPPSVIQHFLKDAADGVHNGIPDLGFRTQDLESPAMKSAFSVNASQGGVLVSKIFAHSPAAEKLLDNDVLLAIDNFAIADDSSIEVRKGLRTNFKYAVDQHHIGDDVKLTVLRNGELMHLTLNAEPRFDSYSLVREEEFERLPEYYIYGGIVFVPLSMNLIKRWGRDWRNKAPTEFLYAESRWRSEDKEETVVALKILAADVNLGYHSWNNWIVDSVNGSKIKNFKDFTASVKSSKSPHLILEDAEGFIMVLDTKMARDSEQYIMDLYQIPSPYSAGLFSEKDVGTD